MQVADTAGICLVLLWLWCRPAVVAPIQPLAWEAPFAAGVALKSHQYTVLIAYVLCFSLLFLISSSKQQCQGYYAHTWLMLQESNHDLPKVTALEAGFEQGSFWFLKTILRGI